MVSQPRVIALVQARMGSSRLPGKSLITLGGRPLLAHVLERVAAAEGVDEVVLATTVHDRDDPLVTIATAFGLRTWRGDEADVLGRMRGAARWARADIVLRVTGDCPLFCPDIATSALRCYQTHAYAYPAGLYVWNDTARSGYPDGTDVEVFSRALLEHAADVTWNRRDRELLTPSRHHDLEHVTPPVRRLADAVMTIPAPCRLARLKLSVDDERDLERVRVVYAHLRGVTFGALLEACVEAGLAQREEVEMSG